MGRRPRPACRGEPTTPCTVVGRIVGSSDGGSPGESLRVAISGFRVRETRRKAMIELRLLSRAPPSRCAEPHEWCQMVSLAPRPLEAHTDERVGWFCPWAGRRSGERPRPCRRGGFYKAALDLQRRCHRDGGGNVDGGGPWPDEESDLCGRAAIRVLPALAGSKDRRTGLPYEPGEGSGTCAPG